MSPDADIESPAECDVSCPWLDRTNLNVRQAFQPDVLCEAE